MAAADAKPTCKIHTNDNESFISDHYKDLDLEVQTIQEKKKAEEKVK